jgi:hypothetical protein
MIFTPLQADWTGDMGRGLSNHVSSALFQIRGMIHINTDYDQASNEDGQEYGFKRLGRGSAQVLSRAT